MYMSHRLQILVDESEMREIRRAAKAQRLTVSEWARAALRRARGSEPSVEPERKLAVIRAAVRHEFPSAGIDRMLAEIERGYGAALPE
jgi:hypothetical protein